MSRIIGIDLGTTNSAAAFFDNGDVKIIPNDRGNRITPSIVAFLQGNDILVGEAAKNQAVVNAEYTVQSAKRHMGTDTTFACRGRNYSPQQISAYILKKLKKDAENYLGEEVTQAVITVPAHFSEHQRRATREAGRLAGLRVKRIINEPTAAALAYAYEIENNSHILVYDLGGGTFDVTYLRKKGNEFTVKATRGDNNLGGIDFDDLLMDKVLADFTAKAGLDIRGDKVIMQQLREQVERAKIELSSRNSAHVAMPFIAGNDGPIHLSFTITRIEFENLIREKIEKTVDMAHQAVKDGSARPEDIQSLILAGGSSRIPLVRSLLKGVFQSEPKKKINPEEVVALGAAIQGSMLAGDIDEIALQDITPFALGLEIEGGKFHPVLQKNTPIPITESRVFTTVSDNQSSVEIHVLQGENEAIENNTSLGRFLLSGIRRGRKGDPRIRVDFGVDADGILHVKAKDVETKSEQKVTMTAGFGAGEDFEDSFRGFMEMKNRINSLIATTEKLLFHIGENIEKSFRKEISAVVKKSKEGILKKEAKILPGLQLELETIIGELNAISQIEKELIG